MALSASAIFLVALGAGQGDPAVPTSVDGIWHSAEACHAGATAPRGVHTARVASWNIRWFPDGTFRNEVSQDQATDVEWLACTIARMNVDVIAVQEFKGHERAQEASSRLLRLLDAHTGGSWKLALEECMHDNQPRVGYLFDESRAQLSELEIIDAINPSGKGCEGGLDPGLAATFTFPGGLDVRLLNVHLKSGIEESDVEDRRVSYGAIAQTIADSRSRWRDDDILVLGDFNTNGGPGLTAEEEIRRLDQVLAPTGHGLLELDAPCTEYWGSEPWTLDHVAAPKAMLELAARRVEVLGFCAKGCGAGTDLLPAYLRLSDHCPLVVELDDLDADDHTRFSWHPTRR